MIAELLKKYDTVTFAREDGGVVSIVVTHKNKWVKVRVSEMSLTEHDYIIDLISLSFSKL